MATAAEKGIDYSRPGLLSKAQRMWLMGEKEDVKDPDSYARKSKKRILDRLSGLGKDMALLWDSFPYDVEEAFEDRKNKLSDEMQMTEEDVENSFKMMLVLSRVYGGEEMQERFVSMVDQSGVLDNDPKPPDFISVTQAANMIKSVHPQASNQELAQACRAIANELDS